MSNKSYLFQIKSLTDTKLEGEKPFDHLIIATESDAAGLPTGFYIKAQGQPFVALGMIELLQKKLDEARAQVYEKLDRAESFTRDLDKLPLEYANKLREFEARAKKAIEQGNFEELQKIKKETEELFQEIRNKKNNNTNTGGFNINDFKGGF